MLRLMKLNFTDDDVIVASRRPSNFVVVVLYSVHFTRLRQTQILLRVKLLHPTTATTTRPCLQVATSTTTTTAAAAIASLVCNSDDDGDGGGSGADNSKCKI